jgi:hypothetical protein
MSNGTSDYTTFCAQIADWANRQDWSPALVASFVSMAEQKFNAELRVDRMINFTTNVVTQRCSALPDDWLEADFVQIQNANGANGFLPIRYKSRDEFFNLSDNWAYGYYTIEGRTMYFGGTPDATEGITYTMNYYGEVPVMATLGSSWIYTKYPSLYLKAALIHSNLYAVGEEQKALLMKQEVEDEIVKLNNVHLKAKASGSRLTRTRVRRF